MAEAKEPQELLLAGESQLQWLEKRKAKTYRVALRLRKSAIMKGWSAEQLNILAERAILNLLDLYKVGKEIAEITIPSKEEAESMKAYKKIAKATIATLENRRDSQAKLEQEFVGTGEGGGAGVLPDPEPDVKLDGDPTAQAVGNPEGEDENGVVVLGTEAFRKKVQDNVHFEEKAKEPVQQSLPTKVGQSPGEVISVEKEKENDKESDSDASEVEIDSLRKLVRAKVFTKTLLRTELAKRDKQIQQAEFWQNSLQQKIDREKRISFDLAIALRREQVKNQFDLTVSRTVPFNSGSLGAIPKVIPNLDGQFKSGSFEKQYVQTVVSLNQTLSVDYKPIEEVRKSNFEPKTSSMSTEMCLLCSAAHPMWRCKKFFTLGVKQRFEVVQANRLCYHCLGAGHCVSKCKYNQGGPCGQKGCPRYHHRLLHSDPK